MPFPVALEKSQVLQTFQALRKTIVWFQGVRREQKFSVSDLFTQVLPLKHSFYIMGNSLLALNLRDTTRTGLVVME